MRLLITSGFWPTRTNPITGIFVVQQTEALAQVGCQIDVILPSPFWKPASHFLSVDELGLRSESVKLHRVSTGRLPERMSTHPWVLRANAKTYGACIRRRLRTLLASGHRGWNGCIVHGLRYTGMSLRHWRDLVQGRSAVVLHGVDPALKDGPAAPARREVVGANLGEGPGHVILVGSRLREYALGLGVPEASIKVVSNGTEIPDVAMASCGQRPGGATRRIVSVSNLIPLKGIDLNLRALAMVLDSRPNLSWEYRIVGNGPHRKELEALTQGLGLSDRVSFLGRISYHDTMQEIWDADIFSLPSWGEAFGIVYLEAMARMRPVIGCIGNGPADFIASGIDGFLVPPKNVQAVATVLEKLLRDPALCAAVGRRAYRTALDFSWEANAFRMIELLDLSASTYGI